MSKKESKKKAREEEEKLRANPVNEFTCCGKTMPFKEFQEHLKNDHKLSKEQLKGKKSMLMHMDGDYWFSYTHQWELDCGLKFTQHTMQARAHDDHMRF